MKFIHGQISSEYFRAASDLYLIGILSTPNLPSCSKNIDSSALPYFNGIVHGLFDLPKLGNDMFNEELGVFTIGRLILAVFTISSLIYVMNFRCIGVN